LSTAPWFQFHPSDARISALNDMVAVSFSCHEAATERSRKPAATNGRGFMKSVKFSSCA
jgi:hypothetical protein